MRDPLEHGEEVQDVVPLFGRVNEPLVLAGLQVKVVRVVEQGDGIDRLTHHGDLVVLMQLEKT